MLYFIKYNMLDIKRQVIVFSCFHLSPHKALTFLCVCEEDWPWANIHCQSSSFCLRKIVAELTSVPIFLYFMWHAATAWLDERCEVPARDPNPWAPGHWSGTHKLNHYATRPAPRKQCLTSTYKCTCYLKCGKTSLIGKIHFLAILNK